MINWFLKYAFLIYFFNTILYSIEETKFIAPNIFYLIMGSGFLFLILNPSQLKYVIMHKSFLFLLLLNLINLSYYLSFDTLYNTESLEYMLARFTQFALICLAIYHHKEYFEDRFFSDLTYIISLIVIIGIFIYPDVLRIFLFQDLDRYSGIILNENQLASMTGIAFGVLLLRENKKSYLDILMMILLFIVSLATGSQLVLIAVFLSFFLKYGISFRNIIYGLLGLIFSIAVLFTGSQTGINRVISGDLFEDRIDQFNFAIDNLGKNLYTGYGLNEYSGLPENIEIPQEHKGRFMGAHNGYLSVLIQYGLIFGICVIILFFRKSMLLIFFFKKRKDYITIYIFIILYTLIAGLFESLFTGINEFQTILFWLSLSVLSLTKYNEEHAS